MSPVRNRNGRKVDESLVVVAQHRKTREIRRQHIGGSRDELVGRSSQDAHGLAELREPLLVERIALHQVFPQPVGRPDPELGGDAALDPIAHRDDGVRVVQLHDPAHGPCALATNCQGILDSCLPRQLAFTEYVPQVKTDVLLGRLEKLSHLVLAQPDGIALERHLDRRAMTLAPIDDNSSSAQFGHGRRTFVHVTPILPRRNGGRIIDA